MKKKLLFLAIALFTGNTLHAQRVYVCHNAFISFFSAAPIEDISAQTDSAFSSIDLHTGIVRFKVPVRTFQFERPLMQQHFNSHYIQSDLYPYAVFNGRIADFTMPAHEGVYPVTVEGDLTIHGVTKTYKTEGLLELKAGELGASAGFMVRLADHDIRIPKILIRNIAGEVQVKVAAVYNLQK